MTSPNSLNSLGSLTGMGRAKIIRAASGVRTPASYCPEGEETRGDEVEVRGGDRNYGCRMVGPGATGQLRRPLRRGGTAAPRSEEHTSQLQSLMRISSAAFCWKQ